MSRNLTIAGVIAFVLVDVVLVFFAMRHVSGDDGSNASKGSTAEASPTVAVTTGKNAEDSQSGSDGEGDGNNDGSGDGEGDNRFVDLPNGPSGTVLLSASDDGTLVHGLRGSCGESGDATVEISTDSGASFTEVTPELSSVLRVHAVSKSEIAVVGTNDDCEPRRFVTEDRGKSWETSSADENWYLQPKDGSGVHGTSGDADPGCTPVSVMVIDPAVARVGCEDGKIRGTEDGGQEWVTLGSLEGIDALAYASPSSAYALATSDECKGQVHSSGDGGNSWEAVGCIKGKDPQAVTTTGDAVIAQVDGQIFTSTDGGETWDTP